MNPAYLAKVVLSGDPSGPGPLLRRAERQKSMGDAALPAGNEIEGVTLSITFSQPQPKALVTDGGLHVPADGGVTKWVFGDTYSIKLTAQLTDNSLGLIEASVPPGGGPVPHTHALENEIFYMLSGELEFLTGEKTFTAGPGDVVFVPRSLPHRFLNVGIRPATMLFMYTPGGAEGLFLDGCGDDPVPGQQAPMWGPERLAPLADLLVKYGVAPVPGPAA